VALITPAALLVGIGALAQSSGADAPAGVMNVPLAWQNWTLNCQGCHRPDGTGSDSTSPSLAGTVAKFLWVPGGREYLGRVPGVATSGLSNADLAELMNWMLWRFDRQDLPTNFQPFSADELGQLRTRPLRLEASQMRASLLKKAEETGRP
jgi:cytochrome c553